MSFIAHLCTCCAELLSHALFKCVNNFLLFNDEAVTKKQCWTCRQQTANHFTVMQYNLGLPANIVDL